VGVEVGRLVGFAVEEELVEARVLRVEVAVGSNEIVGFNIDGFCVGLKDGNLVLGVFQKLV
jgi:hypothetical protein